MPYKAIIITGASGDLGYALAVAYAKKGVQLGLLGRNEKKLQKTQQACEQKGAIVESASINVTNDKPLQQWIARFNKHHPVDLLIANAGITSCIGINGEAEEWEVINLVLDTNLKGVLSTIQPLILPMRTRQQGQIAIVSSLAAYRGLPITPSYCASKAGIKAYGEALRGLLAKENIKVSVICPGFIKSTMSDHFPGAKPFIISPEKAAKVIKKGLASNKACISFPFPLNMGAWLLALLPSFLADYILVKMTYGHDRKR
jgi:short-subunit dehydrogenase